MAFSARPEIDWTPIWMGELSSHPFLPIPEDRRLGVLVPAIAWRVLAPRRPPTVDPLTLYALRIAKSGCEQTDDFQQAWPEDLQSLAVGIRRRLLSRRLLTVTGGLSPSASEILDGLDEESFEVMWAFQNPFTGEMFPRYYSRAFSEPEWVEKAGGVSIKGGTEGKPQVINQPEEIGFPKSFPSPPDARALLTAWKIYRTVDREAREGVPRLAAGAEPMRVRLVTYLFQSKEAGTWFVCDPCAEGVADWLKDFLRERMATRDTGNLSRRIESFLKCHPDSSEDYESGGGGERVRSLLGLLPGGILGRELTLADTAIRGYHKPSDQDQFPIPSGEQKNLTRAAQRLFSAMEHALAAVYRNSPLQTGWKQFSSFHWENAESAVGQMEKAGFEMGDGALTRRLLATKKGALRAVHDEGDTSLTPLIVLLVHAHASSASHPFKRAAPSAIRQLLELKLLRDPRSHDDSAGWTREDAARLATIFDGMMELLRDVVVPILPKPSIQIGAPSASGRSQEAPAPDSAAALAFRLEQNLGTKAWERAPIELRDRLLAALMKGHRALSCQADKQVLASTEFLGEAASWCEMVLKMAISRTDLRSLSGFPPSSDPTLTSRAKLLGYEVDDELDSRTRYWFTIRNAEMGARKPRRATLSDLTAAAVLCCDLDHGQPLRKLPKTFPDAIGFLTELIELRGHGHLSASPIAGLPKRLQHFAEATLNLLYTEAN